MRSGLISAGFGAAVTVLAGGCTGAALPPLPDITGNLFKSDVIGAPTEVYARVARGAMACWFGKDGPLKANYIYHAEAQPPTRGGKALIVIHERDPTSENPRGLRAFRVSIAPSGEVSSLAIDNLKLPEPLAKSMEADVRRWAAGAIGCEEAEGEWGPQRPDVTVPPRPKKKPGGGDRAT